MLEKIDNVLDVKKFARMLFNEDINYHPDDDFSNYVSKKTLKPRYSVEEVVLRNRLMKQSFFVCQKQGVNIYDIMLEVNLKLTQLQRVIPLPSVK